MEGSTALLHALGDEFGGLLADHHRLLRAVWRAQGGVEVSTDGDAFFVAFNDPVDATNAAIAAQHAIGAHEWPGGARVRVRIGIHTGSPRVRDGDYWGIDVHYAARLCAAANGGQVLLSKSTAELVDFAMEDLGEHAVKDFPAPRRLFHLVVDGRGRDSFPPPRTLRAGRTNLPDQVSSLVGREDEIATVRGLLASSRVVTLAGTGGVGKTRLALQVGAEMLDGSGDGVWLVELAPLTDPDLVAATVANVLGVVLRPDQLVIDALIQAVDARRVMLVLDNCEHLIHAAAMVVARLVEYCPGVVVLATSREPLAIAGEQVHRVPPLSIPAGDGWNLQRMATSDAVRLFIERANTHRSGLELNEASASAIAEIVRRLDGIPLAIELAASRLGTLSISDLANRLTDSLRVLTGGPRTAMARQRTVQSLIDWSYDLLPTVERKMLARLSVFMGGFDLDAAEAVCAGGEIEEAEILELLAALVDKSLVQIAEDRDRLRYQLLETVRQFAATRLVELGDFARLRVAHRDHFLQLAEATCPKLDGADQLAYLDRLEAEHDNFRTALAWCLEERDPDPGLRLATALASFRNIRGHNVESAQTLATHLARPHAQPGTSVRASALLAAAAARSSSLGDYSGAIVDAEQALLGARAIGDDRLAARALREIGYARFRQGEIAPSIGSLEDAVALARGLADDHLLATLLATLHTVTVATSPDQAREGLEEAVRLFRHTGDRMRMGGVLGSIGVAELGAGQITEARAHLEEALRLNREFGNARNVLVMLINLGRLAHLDGDDRSARRLLAEALVAARRLGDREAILYALNDLALTITRSGDAEQAARLLGAVDALSDHLGETLAPPQIRLRAEYQRRLEERLGDKRFQRALQAGRADPLDDAVETALRVVQPVDGLACPGVDA